jgi:hypothetical protein
MRRWKVREAFLSSNGMKTYVLEKPKGIIIAVFPHPLGPLRPGDKPFIRFFLIKNWHPSNLLLKVTRLGRR